MHCILKYSDSSLCECFPLVFLLVGKIRKKWIIDTLTPTGVDMLHAVKRQVDPQNIFGCSNILP